MSAAVDSLGTGGVDALRQTVNIVLSPPEEIYKVNETATV